MVLILSLSLALAKEMTAYFKDVEELRTLLGVILLRDLSVFMVGTGPEI